MKTFIFANCKEGKRSLTPDPSPKGEGSRMKKWSVECGV